AAVVAYHLDELPGGFLGVDVFFVVSGFLITRLLLAERERSGRVALGSFWVRRFRRLVPVLAVVLVAVMLGSRAWLPSWRLADVRLEAFSALAYVANWRFVLSGQSYFASGIAPSPLRHTWSLSIEEQFYLLFPLLVVGLAAVAARRTRTVVGVVAVVGALASAVWMAAGASWGWDLSRLYYGTDTRAFGLLAGVALAAGWDRTGVGAGRPSRWWAVAAALAVPVVGAYFVLASSGTEGFYRGPFQGFSVVAVLLVAGVATGAGPLARALGWGPLVWIGRRSYGIYLWSWPTQVFASEHSRLDGLTLDAVVVGVSVALAAVSHWLVEEPIRTGTRPVGWPQRGPRARRARPRRLAPVALSTAAIVGVVGVISVSAAGAPPAPDTTRVSDREALESAIGDISAEEEAQLLAATTTTAPAEVVPPGPFAGQPVEIDPTASANPLEVFGRPLRVLVLGDSVAWSLGWQLEDGFTRAIDLRSKAIIGCGVMPPSSAFVIGDADPEPYVDLCESSVLAELKGLSEEPDVELLWIGAWEVYDHVVDGERLEAGSDAYTELLDAEIQARVTGPGATASPWWRRSSRASARTRPASAPSATTRTGSAG
ncbi:MAG: acyltransferase, partial [Acidimicrobiales bacterium]|nr:acyltransferase [Acidimicrobiales bacterium]